MQKIFSLKLLGHIAAGHEIIYLDESSCDPWNTAAFKTWMHPGDPLHIRIPKKRARDPSYTITGAISSVEREFRYRLTDGNNADTFKLFLRSLRHTRKTKTVYVMDNATIHRAHDVLGYLKR